MKKLTSNFKFLAVIGLCVTGLTVASAGCGDNSSCATADDCYAGESCNDGVCEVDSNNGNNGNNNGTTPANNGTTPTNNGTTPTNNGTTPTNNGTTPTNNGTTPTNNGTTPTNNGTTPTNNGTTPTLACVVDKFSSCADPYEVGGDRNDKWSDADYIQGSAGCVGNNRDEVTPRTWTADGTLCHLEPGDFYNMTVVPCDNTTLIAEARFHPKTMCLPEHFVFNFNRGTAPISCNDAGVSCSMDGEDHIIRKLVPPESTVLSFYASVSNVPDGTVSINLDYTITVSISGP